MRIKLIFIFFLWMVHLSIFPQQLGESILVIEPSYQNAIIHPNQSLSRPDFAPIYLSKLQWYLSGFQLLQNDSIVWEESNSYHLMDISKPSSMTISFPDSISFSSVRCLLGIDSITQMSGVYSGDLDPTTGMYWTWQSGYIHVKIEGTCLDCPTRKNKFQYHLGGFQGENNSLQTLQWTLSPKKENKVNLALDYLFSNFSCDTLHHVMSPSKTTVQLSTLFANSFLPK